MKSTIITCVLSIVIYFCHGQVNSPAVINSSGGHWKGGYYDFEWSVGELALINQMNSEDKQFIVTNGLLQPYTHNMGAGNRKIAFNNDDIRIFPNPASRYVEINVLTKRTGRLFIHFHDAIGQRVYTKEISYAGLGSITTVPVHHLPNGTYMLIIELQNEEGIVSKKGMYKILKVN